MALCFDEYHHLILLGKLRIQPDLAGASYSCANPDSESLQSFTPTGTRFSSRNLGKDLFMDITRGNCQACHTRNVMVQQGAQNIGLDSIYTDNGVGAASGRHAQDGKFSVPSLINIELTPPYMHDGRFRTLEQVIDFYSDSVKEHVNLSGFLREIIPGTINPNNNTCDTCPPRRPHFSPTEKAALVAFLKTLTDTLITTDPRWSNPFQECSTHNAITVTSCGSYSWNGVTYTSSGHYLRSYLNANGCPSVDTLHLTIKNKPLPPASITMTLVSNTCGARIYRYTAPVLTVATTNTVDATGYNWSMPTGPVGSTGVLDSGSLASRIIRIKYSSNAAAGNLDSIRVAYTSTCGNSLNKAVKLSNTKRTGCPRRIASPEHPDAIQFSVSPNPTRDEFSLSFNSDEDLLATFIVYDNNGRSVESGHIKSNESIRFGSDYHPGLYFVIVLANDERKVLRVVKQ
ncbi:MAG: T9SS type A sorting domain-containing protein [Bacteroidota bacterium]